MAFWPRNERTETQKLFKRKKVTTTDKNPGYPCLEPGLIGAATLSDNSYDWIYLSNWQRDGNEIVERRLKFRKQVNVLPPTRPTPIKLERMTLKRRTEEGARFLRDYLPDVHFPVELVREQLSEEVAVTRRLEKFDPYAGNNLDAFRLQNNLLEGYLLFPAGKINCDLNSCHIKSDPARILFEPAARPIYSFPTPIQHLVMSPANNHLAVRTLGHVNISLIKQLDGSSDLAMVNVVDLFRCDTGDEKVVDMKFPSSPSKFLALGNKGGIFDCNFEYGKKQVTSFHETDETTVSGGNTSDFWRLSLDPNTPNSLVILSTTQAFQFDNRVTPRLKAMLKLTLLKTRSTTKIFQLADEKHLLTSIEDVSRANYLQICSTKDILWLDTRCPGKPLLAYAHGREFDQYLSTTTVTYLRQSQLTFLSCRNNGLVTMYEISPTSEGLIQLMQPPHLLSSSSSLYEKYNGQRFLVDDIGMGLVRLSECGSVTYHAITRAERHLIVQNSHHTVGSDTVLETGENQPVLGGINYAESDLREEYKELFHHHFQEKTVAYSESLEHMLAFFPHYMTNNQLAIQHMLTTYDVAFRACAEPKQSSGADYLADSVINSSGTYEALMAGRLSPGSIKSPWHYSIASTLQRLDEGFRPNPHQMMDHLEQFKLVGEGVPEHVRKLEQIAKQQLTLDLMLSCDIFSETRFHELAETLESMTGTLSLGDEPPPVKFGYLRPISLQTKTQMSEYTGDQELETSRGVRLLLKEWDGSDPGDYIYQDPYTATEAFLKSSGEQLVNSLEYSQERLSSIVQPVVSQQPGPIVRTQEPTTWVPYGIESKGQVGPSQECAISSQILPGPFGGRQKAKKQHAKKRLDGF